MAEDPYAEQKAEQAASLAAEVARVYAAARLAMVNSDTPLNIPGFFFDRLKAVLGEGLTGAAVEVATLAGRALGLGADYRFEPGKDIKDYIGIAAGKQATVQFEALGAALGKVGLGGDLKVTVTETVDAARKVAEDDARTQVENVTNAALVDAAKDAGMTTKTWHTGKNPRSSHLAMDGETVGIGERFSNRQRFPGSPAPPAERRNCNCWMTFDKGES